MDGVEWEHAGVPVSLPSCNSGTADPVELRQGSASHAPGEVKTDTDFRRVALALTDAVESAHMGHPDFRVNGRIFATLHADMKFGMVALTP